MEDVLTDGQLATLSRGRIMKAVDEAATVVKVPHERRAVVVSHGALESFTQWVSARSGEYMEAPEVFVGRDCVDARWHVGSKLPNDHAKLPLVACEAWVALGKLIAGTGQKELHKLLTTVLHGYIPDRLAPRFTGGGEDQTEEIGVEWVYTGRVWTCYDAPISVPLRMVISKEKDAGLRFEFAPLGLEARLLEYRKGLADHVTNELSGAGIPVYVGSVS